MSYYPGWREDKGQEILQAINQAMTKFGFELIDPTVSVRTAILVETQVKCPCGTVEPMRATFYVNDKPSEIHDCYCAKCIEHLWRDQPAFAL